MPHTVLFDRGTHWEVIGDYSGSPRISALSKASWQNEYTNSPDFAAMRSSQVGAVADVTPHGTGKWKKDWTAPYAEASVRLDVASNGTPDFDGVLAVDADGAAQHTLTIKKVDQDGNAVTSGGEALRLLMSAGMPISNASPALLNGSIQVTLGPSSNPCDMTVRAVDPAGTLSQGSIQVRFK